eukprot:Phypoly_transcript_18112.p1 GENE.Phypoly_transcript_18112~~Phypoly_transcript_18112.p1  ORF type:complete len:175 (+),score=9.28 Phypoly_transcript_18112:243-767(+)
MADYIKCTKCKNVRKRKDNFLDLQLSIRGLSSVSEALQAFITPEFLNGDNQVSCEICNAKCDAEKGLSLTELPQLLTLQLKRFDFDYATWRRLKLNNKVEFPFILEVQWSLLHKTYNNEKRATHRTKTRGVTHTKYLTSMYTMTLSAPYSKLSIQLIPLSCKYVIWLRYPSVNQ